MYFRPGGQLRRVAFNTVSIEIRKHRFMFLLSQLAAVCLWVSFFALWACMVCEIRSLVYLSSPSASLSLVSNSFTLNAVLSLPWGYSFCSSPFESRKTLKECSKSFFSYYHWGTNEDEEENKYVRIYKAIFCKMLFSNCFSSSNLTFLVPS